MPLIAAKCTSCGAILDVDKSKDAAICQYCGTPFIVEKAINNYHMANNITANTVNIYGGNSADFVICAGVLEKYNGAAEEVIIPNTVKIIQGAFKNCIGITKITIPDSVTEIGLNAFCGCRNLTNINIPNNVTIIGSSVFEGCERLMDITIPNGVTEINIRTFMGCKSLTRITIPNSITRIGHEAFRDCTGLTNITIPNSVTEIRAGAFSGCEALENVTISNRVIKIDKHTFSSCINLKHIAIPANVKTIEEGAFSNTGIKNISVPNTVTGIGSYAFYNCKNLTCVSIPSTCHVCFDSFEGTPYQSEIDKRKKKRNSDKGCYIATAVYNSYDCPQVWTLRRFRDNTLDSTWYGRVFIRVYYAISPTLVKWFGETRLFQILWRSILDRMVYRLNEKGVDNTPYKDR